MSKRTPKPEFTRSANSQAVTLADGTNAQVAHQLKRGIASSYWYYLQWPCGGWREFDVRGLFPEEQEQEVVDNLDAVMLHRDPAVRRTILAKVAELLTKFQLADVKAVSPLWSN